MADSFVVGETHTHRPFRVLRSQERRGWMLVCGCGLGMALIPDEWPVAQTLAMWQDDAQRWDYLQESDRLQREGILCICGRNPPLPLTRHANGSVCGQCDPNAMKLTSAGSEALAEIQNQVISRAVDMLISPPAIIVDDGSLRRMEAANAAMANQQAIYAAGLAQNATGIPSMYAQIKSVQKMPNARHGIEDVRHKGGSTAFRCLCGWGISQQFAKAVFDAHGERELIRLLETHMAGGQVGPITRPKMEWRAPHCVELLQHRPFWASPICRQIWQTPIMSEPAFTPRRRIILEE